MRCITLTAVALCVSLCAIAQAKTGRTFYTDEMLAAMHDDVAGWASKQPDGYARTCAWIVEMSDQQLWDFVPPLTQKRALNAAFGVGCPVHGKAVFKAGGHYPWIISRDKPFKVECPVGHEVYPSNDFVPWHHGGDVGKIDTTEQYVDDGNGYVAPDGQRYYFIGYYIFWQRWQRDILAGIRDLRHAYLLTGDVRYARAAAIWLARLGVEYPTVDYRKQAVHRSDPPTVGGGILDRVWENYSIEKIATCYDAIYPALDDPQLVAFLQSKKIDDVRQHIESRVLWKMVDMVTGGRDGKLPRQAIGNFGMHQKALAILAIVLDNRDPAVGFTKQQKIDWILTGEGAVEEALWNRVNRDGHGGEAAPNYSFGWTRNLMPVAKLLKRGGYDLLQHPKMALMGSIGLDMTVFGRHAPAIGDCGSMRGARRVGWEERVLVPMFEATGDPRIAKALSIIGVKDRDLFSDPPLDEIAKAAEQYGEWRTRTRHLPGYGLAITESPGGQVGMTMFYGYAGGGHGHHDRLSIEMFAFDQPVLTEMGYPAPMPRTPKEGPKRFYWNANNISHYSVVVNRRKPETLKKGKLHTLVGTPHLQMIEADATDVAYPKSTSLYRRTSLLVEAPNPYLIDIYRVDGGWEHAWSFHGPPFEQFETFGVDLSPVQENGTFAGENVPFGEKPTDEKTDVTSGYQFLYNVQRAAAPGEPWGATWSGKDEDLHLRMTLLPGSATRVVRADAEPEMDPRNPESLPWLVALNEDAEHARSTFVAVVEPFKGSSKIGGITPLESRGNPFAAAIAVNRGDDVDIVMNLPGHTHYDRKALALDGDTALLTLRDGELQRGVFVNVRRFTSPWIGVAGKPLEGRIAAVDYHANTITLDGPLNEDVTGQAVVVTNDQHHTTYEIVGVYKNGGRSVLHFGRIPMIVGVGKVKEVSNKKMTTSTEFRRWCVEGARHNGRRILDDAKKQLWRIERFDRKQFTLDRTARSLKAGDRFWIGDVGPGDRWSIATVCHVTRRDDGTYDIVKNARMNITIK